MITSNRRFRTASTSTVCRLVVDCDATAEQLRTEQARTLGARTGGTGTLDSDPSAVHSLKRGATVDVKASAIFDCARWKKGGKSIDILRDRPAW